MCFGGSEADLKETKNTQPCMFAVELAAAAVLGLGWSAKLALCLAAMLPAALFYIGFGLLLGASLGQKQIGAVYSLFVTLSTWLSGMWFDLSLIGRWMEVAAKILPFWYAVDAGRAVLNGNYENLLTDIPVLLAWALGMFALAVWQFGRRLKGK